MTQWGVASRYLRLSVVGTLVVVSLGRHRLFNLVLILAAVIQYIGFQFDEPSFPLNYDPKFLTSIAQKNQYDQTAYDYTSDLPKGQLEEIDREQFDRNSV